jgi:hypothetical protein
MCTAMQAKQSNVYVLYYCIKSSVYCSTAVLEDNYLLQFLKSSVYSSNSVRVPGYKAVLAVKLALT